METYEDYSGRPREEGDTTKASLIKPPEPFPEPPQELKEGFLETKNDW